MQELFVWDPVRRRHRCTGFPPRFVEELRRRGEEVDLTIFRQEE
jgi:hypothetical protein